MNFLFLGMKMLQIELRNWSSVEEIKKDLNQNEATEKVSHSQSGCNCDKVNIQILPYRIFVFEKYLDLL